jgi:hypothetical protein
MSYELWTSPITGYRRKGTRLSDLRSFLGAGILARAIVEPLRCCPWDAPAEAMKVILRDRGFDVAGVQKSQNGSVIGFVARETLGAGRISDYTKQISAEHLVSDAATLSDLLTVLRAKERVFVLAGSEVKGIITRADLNKPPVRVYLFGVISLLEMHMGFWVRSTYDEDSWQQELKKGRLEAANELQVKRRERNEQCTLLDCLQLCDKRKLLLAVSDLRPKLGFSSKSHAEGLLKQAEKLRDQLAHSQQDLVQGTSWPVLIELIEKIEAVVHKSDDAIEQKAKLAHKSIDVLWVTG